MRRCFKKKFNIKLKALTTFSFSYILKGLIYYAYRVHILFKRCKNFITFGQRSLKFFELFCIEGKLKEKRPHWIFLVSVKLFRHATRIEIVKIAQHCDLFMIKMFENLE